MPLLQRNSDFLYLYDATQCNPNGDPDQENKPRMDYDTDTNLVTDTRVKRYIRDYLKATGHAIFVDGEDGAKVSPASKLQAVVGRLVADAAEMDSLFAEKPELRAHLQQLIDAEKAPDKVFKKLQSKENRTLSLYLLAQLVKLQFVDIRLFGSAFAVEGFNRAYTGPVQLNWGYSLNRVKLVESSTIASTMNDDNGTFGKDYRVHYSLLAFNGSINRYAAQTSGLTDEDVTLFRQALWDSIPALPTRSKLNQYPKLYVEVVYKDGVANGQLSDLRGYVQTTAKTDDEKAVRRLDDLTVDLSALARAIAENDAVDYAIVRTGAGLTFDNPKPRA
ncbi:type I-B CRISPR-associated protein Cas7/Csh2 [Hymenobacter sp. H14-R3]|uniref:type I-B CRISPR-associated protein Cas7/Csh2 n=1 Tax=Hymenobacter sp. H14-R3 TaxID=3046308 RepID=UPI0024BBBFE8|nr:type I-B CRISPR-associated protein Cas7/Csh2 [Hymenobacter sp. H14-R3]MDJ0368005.1 type I-B CRISPR-associated protein Cas7/Csh2 [Hymenobacter sp. H14-R3]